MDSGVCAPLRVAPPWTYEVQRNIRLENARDLCQGQAVETPFSGDPWQFWQPSTT